MNALQRDFSNKLGAFYCTNNPKNAHYIEAMIRYHDDDEYQNVTFQIAGDMEAGMDDDSIFYVCKTASEMFELLANIDFIRTDFDSDEEFQAEINKYDDGDEHGIIPEDADYRLYDCLEDFCIVSVSEFYKPKSIYKVSLVRKEFAEIEIEAYTQKEAMDIAHAMLADEEIEFFNREEFINEIEEK